MTKRRRYLIAANTWRAVAVPTGFTGLTLPFTIEQNGRSFRPRAWDVSSLAPGFTNGVLTGKAYYVDPVNGLAGNSGLDMAHALDTLEHAVGKPDYDVIYLAAGLYDWVHGWHGLSPTRSFSLIGLGAGAILSRHETKTWTLVSSHYEATWTVAAGGNGFDASVLTADGYYTPLTVAADVATCDATPGTFLRDATKVYVHLADGRAPDSNCRIYPPANNVISAKDITVYLENITCEGGTAAACWMRTTAPTDTSHFYAKNCAFRYGVGNGVSVEGRSLTILQGCTAEQNTADGFNYHSSQTILPTAIEINCTGRKNLAATTENDDQGSSIHDGGSIVRLMGNYHHTTGESIADIGLGQTWMLGCTCHDSLTQTAALNLNFDSQMAQMWLDSCTSSASTYDLKVATACTIYTRNLISGGNNTVVGSGVITPY